MKVSRITLSRVKGWRKPEGAIVVSRPTIWGNPWTPGDPGTFNWPSPEGPRSQITFSGGRISNAAAVSHFQLWLASNSFDFGLPLNAKGRDKLKDDMSARRALILSRLPELRGHDLCCWCKPGEPCHADVLIRMANQ